MRLNGFCADFGFSTLWLLVRKLRHTIDLNGSYGCFFKRPKASKAKAKGRGKSKTTHRIHSNGSYGFFSRAKARVKSKTAHRIRLKSQKLKPVAKAKACIVECIFEWIFVKKLAGPK